MLLKSLMKDVGSSDLIPRSIFIPIDDSSVTYHSLDKEGLDDLSRTILENDFEEIYEGVGKLMSLEFKENDVWIFVNENSEKFDISRISNTLINILTSN